MSSTPTPYERQFNFTSFEASNPSKPKPGASLDAEFNAVETTLDTTQSRLAEIQRDDGALKNGVVTNDSLDEELQQVIALVQGDVAAIDAQVEAAEAAATAAEASSTNAQTYMTSALASASAANTSMLAADASATESANSASQSATAATLASNSAFAAEASLDEMQAPGGVSTAMLADGAVTYAKVANGMTVDRAYAEYTTNADLTAIIPSDDTIPQNTEGTQILSVSITPKSTTNRIRVRFQGIAVSSVAGNNVVAALFRNGVANALAATVFSSESAGANYHNNLVIDFEHVPGVSTPVTYSVRVGPSTAGTIRMNGSTTGRQLGGTSRATIILEEIKA